MIALFLDGRNDNALGRVSGWLERFFYFGRRRRDRIGGWLAANNGFFAEVVFGRFKIFAWHLDKSRGSFFNQRRTVLHTKTQNFLVVFSLASRAKFHSLQGIINLFGFIIKEQIFLILHFNTKIYTKIIKQRYLENFYDTATFIEKQIYCRTHL